MLTLDDDDDLFGWTEEDELSARASSTTPTAPPPPIASTAPDEDDDDMGTWVDDDDDDLLAALLGLGVPAGPEVELAEEDDEDAVAIARRRRLAKRRKAARTLRKKAIVIPPLDLAICPTFRSGTPMLAPRATVRAPRDCRTTADVVKAFNAGRDFVFTEIMSANNMMSARRDELWAEGFRAFVVYYRGGERMMGLVPSAAWMRAGERVE